MVLFTNPLPVYYGEFLKYWKVLTDTHRSRLVDSIHNALMYRIRNKNSSADQVRARAEFGSVIAQADVAQSSMDLALSALERRNVSLYGSTDLRSANKRSADTR